MAEFDKEGFNKAEFGKAEFGKAEFGKAEFNKAALDKLYANVPGLDCGTCSGHCCVSPTMTAPEFVMLILQMLKMYSSAECVEWLRKPSVEHDMYPGNNYCRMQNRSSGRCEVYPGRALACRLHGHEALRAHASDEQEFCNLKPGNRYALKADKFELMLGNVRDINAAYDLTYEAPYFFLSHHLDAWIDFWLHPEYVANRPQLEPYRRFLDTYLTSPSDSSKIPVHTTLEGQLRTIDRLFTAIEQGDGQKAWELVQSLEHDFPSTASYYLEESRSIAKMLTSG